MTTELTMLAWTLVLALVQVFLPIMGRTRQLGSKWNAGPRDEPVPPPTPVTGRLERALKNLHETLPVFIGAVLIAHVVGRHTPLTVLGSQLYLAGRVVYVPLYALGVSYIRSLAWIVSLAGLLMILLPLLGVV